MDNCREWVANEKRIDELHCTMAWGDIGDPNWVKALLTSIRKMDVAKRPMKLIDKMSEIECVHPWTRAMAKCMAELDDHLL